MLRAVYHRVGNWVSRGDRRLACAADSDSETLQPLCESLPAATAPGTPRNSLASSQSAARARPIQPESPSGASFALCSCSADQSPRRVSAHRGSLLIEPPLARSLSHEARTLERTARFEKHEDSARALAARRRRRGLVAPRRLRAVHLRQLWLCPQQRHLRLSARILPGHQLRPARVRQPLAPQRSPPALLGRPRRKRQRRLQPTVLRRL